ncbi:MAG: DEAD/DEAH box helicase [Thaumarchaeota archaeon]|nr:DEAD/DEAH box helicase [Nitrososphaerota archaeon]
MVKYRCPSCKRSINVDKIYDGRVLFSCNNCSIHSLVTFNSDIDETYIEFLEQYDNNNFTHESLEILLEKERIVRSREEIESMLENYNEDALIRNVLLSKRDYVVDYKIINEPAPENGGSPYELLNHILADALSQKGINLLFKFQEEAAKKILDGKDLVIVAPTASGKTEAFTLPILHNIANEISHFGFIRTEENTVKAIFVYPTKALARDQLLKIKELAEPLDIRIVAFDGDTSTDDRNLILSNIPDIIITNFDVLHYHLMHRTKFARTLRNVKYLVVDEAQVYTGIFGSNVHYIVKRLRRSCTDLQVIAASATLPNSKEFCEKLLDSTMDLVVGKGRRSKVHFSILFPSLRSQRSLMLELIRVLTSNSHKVISFANSHINAELLAFYAAKDGVKIKVHRAGLMPIVRKSVEDGFKQGSLMALSSTPTLELGIDIGAVDGIVSSMVPINRLMQRLGRAARRGQHGYAFLVLGNDPISQYYKNHPDDYLNDFEHAYTDPSNTFVEEYQILAMICDKPLSIVEADQYKETVKKLKEKKLIYFANNRYIANYKEAIIFLHELSIRGVGKSVDIVLDGKKVGERNLPIALEELHDGAIYFLGGRRYMVKKLTLSKHKSDIMTILQDYPYYTKALTDEWPNVDEVYDIKRIFGIQVAYCGLHINKRVTGYVNIEIGSDVAKGNKVMLEEPFEYDFVTKGLVFKAPRPVDSVDLAKDPLYVEMSGYHATEHVVIEGSSMITGGVSRDLGGISLGSSGLIFIYDSSVGGNGASKVLFDRLEKAFTRGKSILSECPCKSESGCPRCTYSYRCGNNNEYLHKNASLEIYNRILNKELTEIEEPKKGEKSFV